MQILKVASDFAFQRTFGVSSVLTNVNLGSGHRIYPELPPKLGIRASTQVSTEHLLHPQNHIMATSILLQGGTVLVHDENDHVNPIKADILIEGNTISKIGAGITATSEVQVIDCTDKILSPGFVDTHHHVWQTLLKGRHANDLLLDYFGHGKNMSFNGGLIKRLTVTGNFTKSIHTPEDLFWGQLAGCLECLDVGTTTVVDHAHLNNSPESSK